MINVIVDKIIKGGGYEDCEVIGSLMELYNEPDGDVVSGSGGIIEYRRKLMEKIERLSID